MDGNRRGKSGGLTCFRTDNLIVILENFSAKRSPQEHVVGGWVSVTFAVFSAIGRLFAPWADFAFVVDGWGTLRSTVLFGSRARVLTRSGEGSLKGCRKKDL